MRLFVRIRNSINTFRTAAGYGILAAVFMSLFLCGAGNIPVQSSEPAGEGQEALQVILQNHRVQVLGGEEEIFNSDPSWEVQDVLMADFDRDGYKELALLVWKQGSYGQHRPFWVENDTDEISQHIFIYRIVSRKAGTAGNSGYKLMPAWMSSALTFTVKGWIFDSETSALVISEEDGTRSAWRWEYFGLSEAPMPESMRTDEIDAEQTGQQGSAGKEQPGVRVLAAGDVIAHTQILNAARARNGQFDFLFEPIKDHISEADLAIVNQETPLVLNHYYSGRPPFASPPELAEAYAEAGFDAVTCATNHMLDRRLQGVLDTAQAIDAVGNGQGSDLMRVGIRTLEEQDAPGYTLTEAGGFQIALLNYTQMTNGQPLPEEAPRCVETLEDEEIVRGQLKEARKAAELVVVCVHWGTEYAAEEDDFQKRWAAIFLEEGVDLVVGTHPHVLQPLALYMNADGHKMPVYYSLGNLISAQDQPERVLGGLAEVSWERGTDGTPRLSAYELVPVVTHQELGDRAAGKAADYSARLLSDYTQELASRHRLGVTLEKFHILFTAITLCKR